jgi:hypothetical protein
MCYWSFSDEEIVKILGASVGQTSDKRLSPQTVGNDSLVAHSCEESVNALPKVVGFLRLLQFPSTGKVVSAGSIPFRDLISTR